MGGGGTETERREQGDPLCPFPVSTLSASRPLLFPPPNPPERPRKKPRADEWPLRLEGVRAEARPHPLHLPQPLHLRSETSRGSSGLWFRLAFLREAAARTTLLLLLLLEQTSEDRSRCLFVPNNDSFIRLDVRSERPVGKQPVKEKLHPSQPALPHLLSPPAIFSL